MKDDLYLKFEGKHVLFYSAPFFWCGTLVRVTPISLQFGDDIGIIYTTGCWTADDWNRAEKLHIPGMVFDRIKVSSLAECNKKAK